MIWPMAEDDVRRIVCLDRVKIDGGGGVDPLEQWLTPSGKC